LEADKALGSGAFAKQLLLASLHYGAGNLQSSFLAAAIVDAICKCRSCKAGNEKDECNDYQ
jgi:hypothetical protein